MGGEVKISLKHIRCWWLGHEKHQQDPTQYEDATCMHCGEQLAYASYSDMVGDTLHNRFFGWLGWLRWSMFRRWFPRKCQECGKRYGHADDCDDIHF